MTDHDKALVEELRHICCDGEWHLAKPKVNHPVCKDAADRIEALSAENERLRELLTKSEALQDLAYYNGAKQYAAISAQSEDAARDWLNGGCGNRQRDAIAALGETK